MLLMPSGLDVALLDGWLVGLVGLAGNMVGLRFVLYSLVGCLVGWFVGCLTGWWVGWMVGWLVTKCCMYSHYGACYV